jgi:formylglycine-generating enzyme required for sulfatase activity
MDNNPSQFIGILRPVETWDGDIPVAPIIGDYLPVEQVTWADCQRFCVELGKKVGKRFRLPTEAEWEYAYRAGTTTAYYTGNKLADLMRAGWCSYDGNWGSAKAKRPVAQLEKNAWNLYDMPGNVWEWCEDWYGPYPKEDNKDPEGEKSGDTRVLRGGSWCNHPAWCRAACRGRNAPAGRHDNVGCRVVLCLD